MLRAGHTFCVNEHLRAANPKALLDPVGETQALRYRGDAFEEALKVTGTSGNSGGTTDMTDSSFVLNFSGNLS